jgi:hypothetical protein
VNLFDVWTQGQRSSASRRHPDLATVQRYIDASVNTWMVELRESIDAERSHPLQLSRNTLYLFRRRLISGLTDSDSWNFI